MSILSIYMYAEKTTVLKTAVLIDVALYSHIKLMCEEK